MKFVHAADWHLSAQRSKLDAETGLNARLMDFYRCARFAVEDGVKRGAQLILHAGDVFNGCRPTPTEVWLAKQAFAPALEAGVPVVVVKGNHDDVRAPAEKHALDLLRDTQGITVVDRPALLNVWRGPFTDSLAAVKVEPPEMSPADGGKLEMQLACLPYPNKQLLLADEEHRKLEPGLLNQVVREKMMAVAAGLAAQRIEGVPCLLLGHFSVDLAQAGGQNRLMMLGGEWTLNVHDLAALPFCYFALGHIHKPQRVWFDERRSMVYCGSPEAVAFGEEGEEKGYVLVCIERDGAADFEWVSTPYRRFVTIDLGDGSALPPAEELAGAIVRVRVPQADDVDFNALRRDLEAAGVHEYQVETQRAETVRRRAVEVSSEMALEEAIKAWLEQRPDLKPMMDAILAEAHEIERQLTEAA